MLNNEVDGIACNARNATRQTFYDKEMKMLRIQHEMPDMFALLTVAPETKQRAVAAAVATLAVRLAGLEDPVVAEGLSQLEHGKVVSDDSLRKRLFDVVERLDEQYFALSARREAGDEVETEMMNMFYQARAASSVCFAFSASPIEAAAEALYEASKVTDNPQSVVTAAMDAVGNHEAKNHGSHASGASASV
jgi:hypothetical protein